MPIESRPWARRRTIEQTNSRRQELIDRYDDPQEPVRAEVRVRYRHTAARAEITPLANNRAHIVFDEPQRAITPGQATVFYRGDEVVGGWIVKTTSNN